MSDLQSMLAEVLAEHRLISPTRMERLCRCSCSEAVTFPVWDRKRYYRAHVAAMQAAALGPVIAAARTEALREAADLLHKEARWQAEMATREPAGTHRRFAAQTIAARMAMHERILRERADREQVGHQDAQDGPGAASRGEVAPAPTEDRSGAQSGDYEEEA